MYYTVKACRHQRMGVPQVKGVLSRVWAPCSQGQELEKG